MSFFVPGRRLLLPLLVICASVAGCFAGDLEFSLRIDGRTAGAGPAHEAAMALWDDPMNRLIRDTNAELGRILVGQPGGMAAPLIGISFRAGVPPAIIAGVIENSLISSQREVTKLDWDSPPTDEEFQEQFIREFTQRLEAAVGRRDEESP